jgi:hypothetical protein
MARVLSPGRPLSHHDGHAATFAEKVVVLDSRLIDTLLAIPLYERPVITIGPLALDGDAGVVKPDGGEPVH